ncbi:segregation/condensation protein A [Candidatus Berkiella cookevillensis]|uniref:Segregation and condensation protein A n=2 Tax=Candidatus Berkiella cookevillensis TaxID=437022 RepID=A0A0Q9YMF5_9GAMM|nr:ScpA family protein [Candidatus Berkiella cookevillensis]
MTDETINQDMIEGTNEEAHEDTIVLEAPVSGEASLPAETLETIAEENKRIARFQDKSFLELPHDLYIPPDALEVILEAFEGPLDLLLYLIRKHNLDILNIPIAEITRQYMDYIHLMEEMRLELAAEYLVMAATLAEIKSRMLLPRAPEESEQEEEDPRAKLIRQLQEYERFKKAAEDLEQLPRLNREIFTVNVAPPEVDTPAPKPLFDIQSLVGVFIDILQRSDMTSNYSVAKEVLSVREKMSLILEKLGQVESMSFVECFDIAEGRLGIVVSFLAILELSKLFLIEIIQTTEFGTIHLKVIANE